jgi:hypothetical protein
MCKLFDFFLDGHCPVPFRQIETRHQVLGVFEIFVMWKFAR